MTKGNACTKIRAWLHDTNLVLYLPQIPFTRMTRCSGFDAPTVNWLLRPLTSSATLSTTLPALLPSPFRPLSFFDNRRPSEFFLETRESDISEARLSIPQTHVLREGSKRSDVVRLREREEVLMMPVGWGDGRRSWNARRGCWGATLVGTKSSVAV
jgi:hypothetical protein